MVTGITFHQVNFGNNNCLGEGNVPSQSCHEQIISDGKIMLVSDHLVLQIGL